MAKILAPQKGPQEQFMASPADIVFYGGAAGGGKAEPLDEPVLTPFGFRRMGDIKVGSKVIGASGKPATVFQVHPQGMKPIYRVTFIDGASVRCTAEHLWLAHEARKHTKLKHREGWRIYDTLGLIERLGKGKNMLIPLCEPVQLTMGKSLGRIRPYTLGALLGDGCLVQSPITIIKGDDELFENIRRDGYKLKEYAIDEEKNARKFGFQEFSEEWKWLKSMGLCCTAEHKFVPDGYKLASIENRYAIIQGLMDTDGYADERGHCEFSTTSEQLARDMQWLIWSIGGKATISEKDPVCVFPDGTKKVCKKAYIVYIQTRDNSKLFRLSRKAGRCNGKDFNGGCSPLCRRIVSIEPCGEAECQCITIDEPNGLYVTKDFIVTHNSFALLLEPLRHINKPLFNALILRSSYTQLSAPGGLWATSQEVYGEIPGAVPVVTPKYHWDFQSGATIYFAHVASDIDVRQWHGSQIAMIGFDEVTDFSEYQFFFMLSRNRSGSGVRPYIRATCNPDPDSWVARFISWWIDQDTGYAIPERSGVIRYMVRLDGEIHWFGTTEEAQEFLQQSGVDPEEAKYMYKSVTFIASKLTDNPALMKMDPGYMANLNALPLVEREQLLNGNWKIRNKSGLMFRRSNVELIDPELIDTKQITKYVRAWDLAATSETEKGDPAYTAGVLMGQMKDGKYYVILDVVNMRLSAGDVENLVLNTAIADKAQYGIVFNRVPQDPGQAGKAMAKQYVRMLASRGFSIQARLESGDKVQRASPVSALWEHGFIKVKIAPWNDSYFTQMESFPEGKFKDMVDATSSAFDELANWRGFNYKNLV